MRIRGLGKALLLAAAIAFFVGLLLDIYVYWNGAASFVGLLDRDATTSAAVPLWSALRDGIASNFLFFLTTGIIAALASSRSPKDYVLVQRVLALYPKLENHITLIEPFVLRARSSAVICVSSHYVVTFRRYLPHSRVYELDVVRKERILNLMSADAVDQDGFASQVEADVGMDDSVEIVGVVSVAQLDIVKPSPGGTVNMLESGAHTLTRSNPAWQNLQRKIEVPADSEGTFTLGYWAYASVGIPWIAKGGWPTEVTTVELKSGLSLREKIEINVSTSLGISTHSIDSRRSCRIVLNPREPRPEVVLNFKEPRFV